MKYALFLLAAAALADTPPIADETLRLAALHAIFPGMLVVPAPDVHIDDSWQGKPNELSAIDAFGKETVYRVTGAAINEAEKQASEQIVTHKSSSTRLIRLQLFPWPDATGMVAVLQYKFEEALPSMACPSIGLLVHLASSNNKWEVKDRYLLETMHHYSLKTVRMLDLTGENTRQLIVESDFGGVDAWGTNFLVFDAGAKLEPSFEVTSQIAASTDDMFTQTIDLPATFQQAGAQYCFSKTIMIESGIAYAPARSGKICYKPNDDTERKDAEQRNKLLAPIHP